MRPLVAMAEKSECCSSSESKERPVVVRVKRKATQLPLEAFWLEINERPLKRPMLDFVNLSLSDSSAKVEELKKKKVFVHHVETLASSDVSIDFLQSIVPKSAKAVEPKGKGDKQRGTVKGENRQAQLLVKAKQKQEVLSKNARFEQLWRSRSKGKEAIHRESLREMYHLYDVVRVDDVESNNQEQEDGGDTDLEDHQMMSSFLPLLREFIPSAAEEIESQMSDHIWKQATKDHYVYDWYMPKNDIRETDSSSMFPLVQVDDDDECYDGPDQSEYESDDSNAEDNPLNDYPEEETSGDEGEVDGEASTGDGQEQENGSTRNEASESEDSGNCNWPRSERFEDEMYCDDDYDDEYSKTYDGDDDIDEGSHEGIWSYR